MFSQHMREIHQFFNSYTFPKVDLHAGRWAHLPLLGKLIQVTFFRKLEDIAVLALAFCHAHEITLKDLATYGVLQASDFHTTAFLGLQIRRFSSE